MLGRAARGEPRRRHARGDRAAARDLPRADRAGRRALPATPARSCTLHADRGRRRGLRGDRRGARRSSRRDHPQGRPRRSSAWRAPATSSQRRSRTVGEHIRPGITTGELDDIADEFIAAHGGDLDVEGLPRHYPAEICISPNSMVVHGIPGAVPRRGGRPDHGRRRRDRWTARSPTARTRSASARSIPRRSGCSTSARTRSPPASRRRARATGSATSRFAVQTVVEGAGFSVVRSLVGHGVGRHYHEDPHVPNFGQPGRGPEALRGDDDRDRADDHGRARPTSTSTTTTGRSRPRTARSRRTSSTPSRSRPPARGS